MCVCVCVCVCVNRRLWSGVLSAYNQRKLAAAEAQRKEAEKLAKKKMAQLQLEHTLATRKRETEEAKKEAVDNLMTYYKKPMLAAAFDLQSRLGNMVKADFLHHFMHKRWAGQSDGDPKPDPRAGTDKARGGGGERLVSSRSTFISTSTGWCKLSLFDPMSLKGVRFQIVKGAN